MVRSSHPAQTALKELICLQHFTLLLEDPTSLGLKQLFKWKNLRHSALTCLFGRTTHKDLQHDQGPKLHSVFFFCLIGSLTVVSRDSRRSWGLWPPSHRSGWWSGRQRGTLQSRACWRLLGDGWMTEVKEKELWRIYHHLIWNLPEGWIIWICVLFHIQDWEVCKQSFLMTQG